MGGGGGLFGNDDIYSSLMLLVLVLYIIKIGLKLPWSYTFHVYLQDILKRKYINLSSLWLHKAILKKITGQPVFLEEQVMAQYL
jgi:hypothetical protein